MIRFKLVLYILTGMILTASAHGDDAEIPGEYNYSDAVLKIFNTTVSPVDGDRCQMYPSCSEYAKQAIDKHGLFIGWIMACDRLVRCGGDETDIAEEVYVNRRPHCYDPLKNNDFWMEKP
jgi:putative component of membrane protein insertase Oxa1/YidC/SpoIIIJ protein YidD